MWVDVYIMVRSVQIDHIAICLEIQFEREKSQAICMK